MHIWGIVSTGQPLTEEIQPSSRHTRSLSRFRMHHLWSIRNPAGIMLRGKPRWLLGLSQTVGPRTSGGNWLKSSRSTLWWTSTEPVALISAWGRMRKSALICSRGTTSSTCPWRTPTARITLQKSSSGMLSGETLHLPTVDCGRLLVAQSTSTLTLRRQGTGLNSCCLPFMRSRSLNLIKRISNLSSRLS